MHTLKGGQKRTHTHTAHQTGNTEPDRTHTHTNTLHRASEGGVTAFHAEEVGADLYSYLCPSHCRFLMHQPSLLFCVHYLNTTDGG